MLFTHSLQAPYALLGIAAVLCAAISLALTQLKNRRLKRATEELTCRFEKEITLRLQSEEDLRTSIADLEQRLWEIALKASQNTEQIDQFRQDCSSSTEPINSITSTLLSETKNVLLQCVSQIETVEENTDVVHIREKRSLKDSTLKYHLCDAPQEPETSHTSPRPGSALSFKPKTRTA